MVAPLTKEEFITRARNIHGNKYTYDKITLPIYSKKQEIGCPIHGFYFQTALSHLRGHSCIKCAGVARSNTEEFIMQARKVHGDRYDYSQTVYKNRYTKVTIICRVHGPMLQFPGRHLSGSNCIKCAGKATLTKEEFIKRARQAHGDKYNYDEVVYTGRHTKVKIICPRHGPFTQSPGHHWNSHGCPLCAIGFGERYCRYALEKIFNKSFPQCNPDFLKYKRNLQLDGYCAELNIAFEYQGPQHYGEVTTYNHKGKMLDDQLDRDAFKREKCNQLGIKLIEIPFFADTFHYAKLKSFIRNACIKMQIELPENFDEIIIDYREVI